MKTQQELDHELELWYHWLHNNDWGNSWLKEYCELAFGETNDRC